MVIAVSDDQARGSFGDLREHAEFVDALAGATEMRVITPGQQTLACTLKP